ncbi:nidogen-1 isoform 2-T2 [Discoglossus pictus]
MMLYFKLRRFFFLELFHVLLCLLPDPGSCINVRQLFPYGPSYGDLKLQPGDDVSKHIPLRQNLQLYDSTVSSLYVSTNGIITASEPSNEEDYLEKFPTPFGVIAPFFSDLDTSVSGNVYFREDSSQEVLESVASHIYRGFPESIFYPKSVLIFTWENVAPYYIQRGDGIPQNKRNTFQAILASDNTKSYAVFLYPEEGLGFSATQSKKSPREEISARVGFGKGDVKVLFWTKQGPYNEFANEKQSIESLPWNSNSGMQGVWVYEIGGPSAYSSVVAADVETLVEPTVPAYQYDPQNKTKEELDINDGDRVNHHGRDVPDEPNYDDPYESDLKYEIPEVIQTTTLTPDDHYIEEEIPQSNFRNQFNDPSFLKNNPQVVVIEEDLEATGVVFRYNVGNQQTCANNRHQCSNHATCTDYSTGFCCNCISGYYGNGRQCVAEGSAQRVNGKVKGRIFVGNNPAPVVFENIDLHSYIVVNDGRAYTAISTIVDSLGYSLLPLASIGGIIGWMFAVQQPGYKNGFSLTGGEFTRRAEVNFLKNSEKIVITQEFSGIDEHGHLTISTNLEGSVPEIPIGSTVHVEPYTELYHTSSSIITSSSTREYTVEYPEEGSETFTYQWKQTLSFQECVHDNTGQMEPSIQQLSVDRVFVLYNTNEQILRFASSNSLGPVSDVPEGTNRNPCYIGTHGCDTNAVCRPGQGSQFTCECTSGFRGEGRTCYDIDECLEQPYICGSNAICNNQPGTFRCECIDGYQFLEDGRTCVGPEKTKCQQHRESILGSAVPRGPRPVGQFVPTCDENGNYAPIQCHSSTGYCWCVDRDGNELNGTRTGPGFRPPCLDPVTPLPPVGPTVRPDVDPLPTGTHLLFAQSGKIEHVPLEGNNMKKADAKALLHIPDKVIIGLSYDCVDKFVYWTDISGPSISRASIHGGEPTTIIKTDLGSPEGIAVDHLGRNIFWTDSVMDKIEVAKLDGSHRRVLIDTDLENPRGIVADASKGNLYWTDWNRAAPKIETSYLDGTNRRILVKDDLGLPNGLTIDPYSSMLCWVDAGTKRMECMNPNQPGRQKIAEGMQYPFGVTIYGKNLYYTDWKRDAVVAVDRTISKENDNFQPHKRSRLYGITTAFSQCPQGHSYCTVNNGGCSHLCLATPGGRSCMCPENSVGVDCIESN